MPAVGLPTYLGVCDSLCPTPTPAKDLGLAPIAWWLQGGTAICPIIWRVGWGPLPEWVVLIKGLPMFPEGGQEGAGLPAA